MVSHVSFAAGEPGARALGAVACLEGQVARLPSRGWIGDPAGVTTGERQRLRQRLPAAGVTAELTDASARALAELVLDPSEPWWRRRACVLALVGRVPEVSAAGLLRCAQDVGVTTELRAALLGLLARPGLPHAAELLAWLRAQDGAPQRYGLDVAISRARASLADLTVAARLAELAADPWTHRREPGERAIDELIAARGLAAVLAALGVDSPATLAFRAARAEERLLGVRLLDRAGGDVSPALADRSRMVARAACERLVASGDDAGLMALVEARGPGQLWALVALHGRGHDVRAAWGALGSPRVPLPEVPMDVRAAIVRAYAPGQRETDPRWLLEAACLEPTPAIDEAAQLERAAQALRSAGVATGPPVSAGHQHGIGAGTYHELAIPGGAAVVSALGPFFYVEGEHTIAIAALRAAGFRHIAIELARVRVEGLCVYHFGDRGPRTVGELLFYWQD